MAFKVFEKDSKDVYFRVEKKGSNGIKLVACDRDGMRFPAGMILSIGKDGKLMRYAELNKNLGLCLDEDGCILDMAEII